MARIKFFLLSVFICISTFSSSQKTDIHKIGVTAGIGYNTQVKEKDKFFPVSFYYYNRFSPYLGLVYRDSITRLISLKADLYYIQRGVRYKYKYETPFYNLYADQIFTCHYISFPIKLNFNFGKFFVGAGLEGSILLTGHYDTHFEENDPTSGYVHKYGINKWYRDDYFQPVDAGYNFSLGYRKNNWEIELSLFHGLINPPKFFIFTSQHFEFQYLYQQTFMLGINYFPTLKRHLIKKAI